MQEIAGVKFCFTWGYLGITLSSGSSKKTRTLSLYKVQVCYKHWGENSEPFFKACWSLNLVECFFGLTLDCVGFWLRINLKFVEAQLRVGMAQFEFCREGSVIFWPGLAICSYKIRGLTRSLNSQGDFWINWNVFPCFPLEDDLTNGGWVIHTFTCGTPMTRLTPTATGDDAFSHWVNAAN